MLFIFFFIVFYLFSVYYIETNIKSQNQVVLLVCVILTFLIGYRDISVWPDTLPYVATFNGMDNAVDFVTNSGYRAYSEKGYLFLAYLVKMISSSSRFYLIVMAGLSMFFLYKSLSRFCLIPLIGLCDYIARFVITRDCIQMRSSLAIFLIIWGIHYVHEKKIWHYLAVVAIASLFHRMALIGLPFYFFNYIRWDKKRILWSIIIAMVLSQVMAGMISGYVESYSDDLNYGAYVQGQYVEQAKGLGNPMIYFQISILLLYTWYERVLAPYSKYYYLFRSGYLYSTLILIFFCNYTTLSGRTSTLFATLEMFMIAIMAKRLPKDIRVPFIIVVGIVLVYFLFNKYNSVVHFV